MQRGPKAAEGAMGWGPSPKITSYPPHPDQAVRWTRIRTRTSSAHLGAGSRDDDISDTDKGARCGGIGGASGVQTFSRLGTNERRWECCSEAAKKGTRRHSASSSRSEHVGTRTEEHVVDRPSCLVREGGTEGTEGTECSESQGQREGYSVIRAYSTLFVVAISVQEGRAHARIPAPTPPTHARAPSPRAPATNPPLAVSATRRVENREAEQQNRFLSRIASRLISANAYLPERGFITSYATWGEERDSPSICYPNSNIPSQNHHLLRQPPNPIANKSPHRLTLQIHPIHLPLEHQHNLAYALRTCPRCVDPCCARFQRTMTLSQRSAPPSPKSAALQLADQPREKVLAARDAQPRAPP
ncbi:hypothetical protein EJ04DRAFT_524435 [Polyplosphaeria fusca]|uniref:Uncharacterized protein n=1 Tax=Polyplosphaeria fusca TaxID=682080 RepID=A0A9P4V0H9_9PLEO|nr:hypothetical protein EJ04DRAFT_524435 [Polyplosphaeria fusca]